MDTLVAAGGHQLKCTSPDDVPLNSLLPITMLGMGMGLCG